jgi:glycogen synthase
VICGVFFIQVSYAKPLLKEALQAEVGLPVDGDIPVIGFIGRLEEQRFRYSCFCHSNAG